MNRKLNSKTFVSTLWPCLQTKKKQKTTWSGSNVIENLDTNTESKKQKSQTKKYDEKLLQHPKQFCKVKSSTFAISTKNTVVKSPKTWI